MFQKKNVLDRNKNTSWVIKQVVRGQLSLLRCGRRPNDALLLKLKSITVLLYDLVFGLLRKISNFAFAINNSKMNG